MRIIIKPDYDSVSLWTADYIADKIKAFAPTEEKPFVLGLPTGSTPLGVYAELIKKYQRGEISFTNVITFNMDEYVGLDDNHPQSYHYFMHENFFKHINIKQENIHILNGMAGDVEKECENYERAINACGGINLFLGGLGEDGHIAFNEPFSSLTSRTRIKTLTSDTIRANSRFFDNDISQVPATALTVGIGTIMDAQEVIILATGTKKAKAVRHAIEESVTHKWPVSVLQNHRKGIIVCDTDATHDLEEETVNYFKDIEK
uniref:Glucosamine-6-phosphate deaminase n=1 Tax=uncultured Alphaproteobacteria bacterium TaxID=91750 RepID=A0A6G8F334_9PROT|nr:glucosamine-6-phosphate deaminase [uncultured Alphaproteobacteria bacterium]